MDGGFQQDQFEQPQLVTQPLGRVKTTNNADPATVTHVASTTLKSDFILNGGQVSKNIFLNWSKKSKKALNSSKIIPSRVNRYDLERLKKAQKEQKIT